VQDAIIPILFVLAKNAEEETGRVPLILQKAPGHATRGFFMILDNARLNFVQRSVAGAIREEQHIGLDVLLILLGNIFFGEDGVHRAFGDTGATIDAGVRIDVIQRPFFFGDAGDDALDGAHIDTSAVTDTDFGNYMGHNVFLLFVSIPIIVNREER
jgi:hypothetical protein